MNELDAVNDMLDIIGEQSVSSLEEAASVPDASHALNLLRRESRSLQLAGWHFNSEQEYRIAPNNAGEIIIPPNADRVDPTDIWKDYVVRAGKLWDRDQKTFEIGEAVLLDIVFVYPFDELPQTFRSWVATQAARKFENRRRGDGDSHQVNEMDVVRAKALFLEEECDRADYNVVRNSTSVNKVVRR